MFRLVSRPTTSRQLLLPLSATTGVRTIVEPRHDPQGSLTITEAVYHDHRELENYYARITTTDEKDLDTKQRWQNQLTWELARHAVGEEIVLYPAYEKYLGEKGKKIADKNRDLNQQTKVCLEYFQRLYPKSPEFTPKLNELMENLKLHIRASEDEELPPLEEALKPLSDGAVGGGHGVRGLSEELARSFDRTKMFVPTRGHPWMPNKPPYETVVGFLATPVDLLADMFRKFPKERQRTTESWNGEGLR